jgi:glycosyltransferase involved in cell wall biosynthesis
MKKTRILIVLPNLNAGGAEQVALALAKNFCPDRYEVKLFLVQRTGAFMARLPVGLPIVGPEKDRGKLFNALAALPILVKEAMLSDVVLGALELFPTYISYLAGKIARRPVVGWVHIDVEEYLQRIRPIHGKLMRFVYPKLEHVVAVSSGVAESLSKKFLNSRNDKLSIIYNINEILGHTATGNTGAVLSATTQPYLLAVGRMTEQKAFDVLLEAHARLVDRVGPIRLVILGDGPERATLEEQRRRLGTEQFVEMPGYVDNVHAYMRDAWLFVHPARYEGLGMVLIEAMAAGKPVVATDCPSGPKEILQDGKFGVLVKSEAPDAIADAVIMLQESPDTYQHFSALGVRRAQDFSARAIMPQWEKVISKLIGNGR